MSEEKPVKKFLSKIKIEYLIVIALASVCVVAIFGNLSQDTSSEEEDVVEKYVTNLENKLKSSLSLVKNAGEVEVIISVASGMETVLATEKVTEDNKTTETPFTIGGKTVVLTENYPKITGVIIVADGANNLTCRAALLNATTVFLDIDSDKIQILPKK